MAVYGSIRRKPYSVDLVVHRSSLKELLRDFPDVQLLNHKGKRRR